MTNKDVVCTACDGSGTVPTHEGCTPDCPLETCANCNGSGRIFGNPDPDCTECGGSGLIPWIPRWNLSFICKCRGGDGAPEPCICPWTVEGEEPKYDPNCRSSVHDWTGKCIVCQQVVCECVLNDFEPLLPNCEIVNDS